MASGDRVTNVQLQSELKVIRTEQKSEHFKTRLFVAVSAALTGGTKLASVLGVIKFPHIF